MHKTTLHFGFSTENRLTGVNAYRHVMQGLITKCGNIIAYYSQNQLDNPRLGIVVSKRISKKAVVRNYLKRMIRESFRLTQHQLNNLDIVVIIRHSIDIKNNHTLHEQLNIIWKRLSHKA
jgi:ribonuclease P protein component